MTGKFSLQSRYAAYAAAALGAVVIGVTGVATAAPQTAPMAPPPPKPPIIDMEHVVVQGQVEPWLNKKTGLPGNGSVQAMQSALRAKGYGTTVDGWFGDGTRADYARWQRKLGYSGNAANGIPGPTSLVKLGSGRFNVGHRINTGSKVSHDGQTLNQRTRNMLVAAEKKTGLNLRVTKGSYKGCDGSSACTHAFGGAVDLSVRGISATNRWKAVKALRQVGFAAWLRTPPSFDYHIHAIAIGDTDMHIQSADQVGDYYRGRNGLSGHAEDNTPPKYRTPFTWWERFHRG